MARENKFEVFQCPGCGELAAIGAGAPVCPTPIVLLVVDGHGRRAHCGACNLPCTALGEEHDARLSAMADAFSPLRDRRWYTDPFAAKKGAPN